MMPDERIFFVLGYQKSGTTWIASLLRAHPDIHCNGEGHFLRGDDSRRYLPDVLASCVELQAWSSEHSNLWMRGESLLQDADLFAAAITRAILQRASVQTGKRLIGDKSGLVGPRTVKSVYRMFPGARILHIVRDPRDVAVSKCFHLWRGVSDGAHILPPEEDAIRNAYFEDPGAFGSHGRSIFHPDFLRSFAQEWAAWVPGSRELGTALFGSRYMEIRYEELSRAADEILTRALDFLGAPASSGMVRSCVEQESFLRQSGRQPGELEPRSYFRRGITGDWRNFFTLRDLELLNEWLGPAMEQMEYAHG